jgi:anaerobic C4-dicarboxylate transporter DcuA
VSQGLIADADMASPDRPTFTGKQKASVAIFGFSVIAILSLAMIEPAIPSLTEPVMGPSGHRAFLAPTAVVQMFMYLAAAAIMVVTGLQPKALYATRILPSAINAAVAVLGPSWLGATIFQSPANARILSHTIGPLVHAMPWTLVVFTALITTFVMSQTAVISIIFPLALGLGVPPGFLAAMIPAVNVDYFIPAQPTILFAEEIDTTGSTRKFRFWPGGLVSTVTSVMCGVFLWKVFL